MVLSLNLLGFSFPPDHHGRVEIFCTTVVPVLKGHLHREPTCGCVKISIYTPSVHACVCIYLRLWAQSSNIHVGVYVLTCRHAEFGCGDVRACMPADFVWVCVYVCMSPIICLRIYTRSLYVCVYIFTYIHTASICMCVQLRIYTCVCV